MYNTRAILTFSIIVISSALVSCSPSKTEKIYMAEQKWLEGGKVKYQMTITNSSLWLEEEYTVIVENGVVKIVKFDCTPGLIGFEDLCESSKKFISQLDTVDELFDRANEWVMENDGKNLQIRFNNEYGYPTYMSYDNPDMADEEETITVNVVISE